MKASANIFPKLLVAEGAPLAAPAAGTVVVYAKGDGKLYSKDSAGNEVPMFAGAGSAGLGLQLLAETSSTADAAPGDGKLTWNHATQASATVIYVDDDTVDAVSLTGLWPALYPGGLLTLQNPNDAAKWQVWKVTGINDAAGYAKLTVALVAKGTNFADGDPIRALVASGGAPQLQVIPVAIGDETTPITAGTAKVTFINPFSTVFNLVDVVGSVTTAQATSGGGGILTFDLNEAGSSLLSTKLTIDNTEKKSSTAATPVVISDAAIAAFAELTIDVDQVGDGTAAGGKVYLVGWPSP